MAWETGVASTLDDLLDKMCAFAVAEAGFTELTQLSSGRQSDMYILQRGSHYWWFLGNEQALTNYGDNGYIEARMMTVQPTLVNRESSSSGQRYLTRAQLWNKKNGPFTNYWFYSNGQNVLMVVEVVPNVFTHLVFGVLDKFGTWTGGEFLAGMYASSSAWNSTQQKWTDGDSLFTNYGSYPFCYAAGSASSSGGGYLYFPQDSYGDQRDFALMELSDVDGQHCLSQANHNLESAPNQAVITGDLAYRAPNAFNSRAILIPLLCLVRDTTSNRRMILGHVSNYRFLNMALISPKETIEVKWDVYPFMQKDGDSSVASITKNSAYAYERA